MTGKDIRKWMLTSVEMENRNMDKIIKSNRYQKIMNNERWFLRLITQDDLELLRNWKNAHRNRFFYKDLISKDEQKKWFEKYQQREDDYMFILEEVNGNCVGCLGYRIVNGKIDLYNIIRGRDSQEDATMRDAMLLLVEYLKNIEKKEITCLVLKDNPAFGWYKKCGFMLKEEQEDAFLITI